MRLIPLLFLTLALAAYAGAQSEDVLSPRWERELMPSLNEKVTILDVGILDINYDGYGEAYAVVSDSEYTANMDKKNLVAAYDFNGSKVMQYGIDSQLTKALPYDIDNDRRIEFLLLTGQKLNNVERGELKIVGSDGRLIRTLDTLGVLNDIDVGDLNGDRYPEIVGGSNGKVWVFNPFGEPVWEYPERGQGLLKYPVNTVKVADLDSDGAGEVVAGADKLIFLDAFGGLMGAYDFDRRTDPKNKEITSLIIGKFGGGFYEDTVAVIEGETLKVLSIYEIRASGIGKEITDMNRSNTITLNCKLQNIRSLNLDADALTEMLATCPNGMLYALDSNGRVKWDYPFGSQPTDIEVTDMDGDRVDDILVSEASGRIYMFGLDGALKWMFSGGRPILKLAAGDMDGDGIKEVATVVEGEKLIVYTMDEGYTIRRLADMSYAMGQDAYIHADLTGALEHFKQAKTYYMRVDDMLSVSRCQSFIKEIEEKLLLDRQKEADTLYSKAQEYFMLRDYRNALDLVEKSAKLYADLGSSDGIVRCELLKLQIERALGAVNPSITLPPTTTTLPEGAGGIPPWLLIAAGLFVLIVVAASYIKAKGGGKRMRAIPSESQLDDWGGGLDDDAAGAAEARK